MKIRIVTAIGIFLSFIYSVNAQLVLSTPDTPNKKITAPGSIHLKAGYRVTAQSGTRYHAFIDSDGDGFPDQDIPPGTPPENGSLQSFADTKGDINISNSGALQYKIPIALPPGIRDIAPQISIEYNSNGGNGMVGFGWNLVGISSIAKVNSNLYLDGEIDSNLTNYSLDGQRLLYKNSGSGGFERIYETENYTNLQIQAKISQNNNAVDYFRVVFPDGVIAYYGNSEDTKGVSEYLIKKWIDPQGNVIEYSYITSNNIKLISEIKWGYNENKNTGYYNSIKFYYKERTRPEYSYIKGQKIVNQKILDKVEVLTSTQVFKKYVFSHISNDLGYDFISQVQEFNGDNEPANPIRFAHTFTKDQVNVVQSKANTMDFNLYNDGERNLSAEKTLVTGDFDGDGRLDYITTRMYHANFVPTNPFVKTIFNGKLFEPGDFIKKEVNLSIKTDIHVEGINAGKGVVAVGYTVKSNAFPIITTDHQGKLNQKNSLLVADNDQDNQRLSMKIYDYNGSDFQLSRELFLPVKQSIKDESLSTCDAKKKPGNSSELMEGDFNGDGISDIIVFNRVITFYDKFIPCQGDDELCTPPGGSFPPAGVWDGMCIRTSTNKYENNIYLYNTDQTVPESSRNAKIENTSIFDSFYSVNSMLRGTIPFQRYVIDFDGDGKSDIIFISGEDYKVLTFNYQDNNLATVETLAQGKISELRLNLNSGDYMNRKNEGIKEIVLGDLNGDGKTDLMIPLGNGNKDGSSPNKLDWVACLSTGSGFEKVYQYDLAEYKPSTKDHYQQRLHLRSYHLLDINGDGKSDFVMIYRDRFKVTGSIGDHDVIMTLDVYKNLGNKNESTPKFQHSYNFYKRTESPTMPIPFVGNYRIQSANFEILLTQNQNVWAFNFQKDNLKDQLMSSVTEGSGLVYKPIFKSLGNYTTNLGTVNDLYHSSNTEFYPLVEVRNLPKLQVVEEFQKIEPGGSEIKQKFKYFGITMHSRGMGMLGFKKTARTNWMAADGTTPTIWQMSVMEPAKRGVIIEQSVLKGSNPFVNAELINKKTLEYEDIKLSGIYALLPKKEIILDKITGTTKTTANEYDAYKNIKKRTISTGSGQQVTDYTYANNPSGKDAQYYIGRLTGKTAAASAYGDIYTTEEKYTYTENLISQTQKKGYNTDYITESMGYDAFGNLVQKTISASGVSSLTIKDEYEATGRFVVKKTDADNLTEQFSYNNWGQVLSHTSSLNVTTQTLYDSWGKLRKVATTGASDTPLVSYTNYERTKLGGVKVTSYNDQTGDYSVLEKDIMGRDIRGITKGFTQSVYIHKSIVYDVLGRKVKESEPYFSGSIASQWNTIEYDDLSRPVKQRLFTGKEITNTYAGLSVTTKDGVKTQTLTKDANGNTVKVVDNGETLTYTYYANGGQKTSNYNGHVITTKQDDWGRRISLHDPSVSTTPYTYAYNNYGELLKETTPNGSTAYTYSPTGKILTKTITGDNTDIKAAYEYSDKGLLLKETGTSGEGVYSYHYAYDHRYRLSSKKESTPQASYLKEYTYDQFSRGLTEKITTNFGTLSSSVSVKNQYNSYNGILEKMTETAIGKVIWQLAGMNERMQVLSAKLGNGVNINNTIDGYGFITKINHQGAVSAPLSLTYTFDIKRGTLTSRSNQYYNWNEQFTYDSFDRLVSWSDPNGTNSNTYASDGRITTNSQVGNYDYTGISRYKKSSIQLNTTGEAIYKNKPTQQITYNSFKNPVQITEGVNKINFAYNIHSGRTSAKILLSNSVVQSKYYSDDYRVEIIEGTSGGKIITYISGSPYDAPVMYVTEFAKSVSNLSKGKEGYYYLHRDYQGTILAISDDQGKVIERRLFDPWGKVMKVTDVNGTTQTSDPKFIFMDRGYTGHEHFFSVGLIHMNGRMYDPVLKQFLSPDNFIQDSSNSQNYNRYGYVLNNPLMYTDPSGEIFLSFIIAAAVNVAVTYITALNNEVDTSAGIIAKTAWMGGMSGIMSYGVGYAAQGLIQSISSTLGNKILVAMAQASMHGVSQGFIAGISGGDVGQGFSSGALGSLAASVVGIGGTAVGIDGSTTIGTLTFGTVGGGFGSVLAGGNFWQGAATGLVVSGLNHVAHELQYKALIQKEVAKAGFNPYAKPPETLEEANKVKESVGILKIWDNLSGNIVKIEGINPDLTAYAVTYNKGRSIKLGTKAFSSYAQLALVIGHELQHVYHHYIGDYDKWLKRGVNYAKSRTEYEAWNWTSTYSTKYLYGAYDEYKYWRNEYIRNGGNP